MRIKTVSLLSALALLSVVGANRAEDPIPDVKELTQALLSRETLPSISFRLEYKADSVLDYKIGDESSLKPQIELDCSGLVDLATGKLRLALSKFKEREAGKEDAYVESSGQIAFDGTKWVYVREVEKNKTPEVSSVTRVSSEPPMFLTPELYPFGFPLYASLLKIQFGKDTLSLAEIISSPEKLAETCTLKQQNSVLSLTIKKECIVDRFDFDAAKNFVLISRTTYFSECPNVATKVENRFKVTSLVKVNGLWFPEAGEMQQLVDNKVKVKRTYKFSSVELLAEKANFDVPVPARSIVTDQRFGFSFLTK